MARQMRLANERKDALLSLSLSLSLSLYSVADEKFTVDVERPRNDRFATRRRRRPRRFAATRNAYDEESGWTEGARRRHARTGAAAAAAGLQSRTVRAHDRPDGRLTGVQLAIFNDDSQKVAARPPSLSVTGFRV